MNASKVFHGAVPTRILPAVLGIVLITGAASPAREPVKVPQLKARKVVIEPASIQARQLGKVDFELGTLHVPENRAEGNSRLIGVGFARFKAASKSDVPPIFLLPGGPGGSYLDDLKPDNPSAGLVQELLRYRAISDVIVVDQRGFSERGDVLKLRFRTADEPLDEPASLQRSTQAFRNMARAVIEKGAKEGIDLRGYTIKECADDVNDLRHALGYDSMTLVGGSFGSQWSFAVMRRHPERVARALLSGVEPLDCGYDLPSHVLAAIQRMWRDAENDPRIRPYLPPGGLMAAAREVLQRLERSPIQVSVKGVSVTLGPGDFQRAAPLRTTAGPEFVLSLLHRQYEAWAYTTSLMRRSRDAEFPIIAGLIDTGLGATPGRRYLIQNDPALSFLGLWGVDAFLRTADLWPTPDVGDDFRAEVDSSIPVVFVQGDWDTQTPVENALKVAPYFRNGHVLLVERGGHGVMNQISRHLPETKKALLDFLKDGRTENLPVRVTVPAPPFGVGLAEKLKGQQAAAQ